MGRGKSRFWARGCGRNPASLGIKWIESGNKDKRFKAERMTLNGKEYLLEILVGNEPRRIWVDKERADILIALHDSVRRYEYDENNEIPHIKENYELG